MSKIQEVPYAESRLIFDTVPLEKVHTDDAYNVFANDQEHTDQPENMNDISLIEKVDSNTTPDSSDVCNNDFEDDQNANDQEDECRSALHNQEIELEKYKKYKDCRIEKEYLERKLKSSLDRLAQQKVQTVEAIKALAYETFQYKEKNAECCQHVAPTTAEQRLAKKNELKDCGTLLMALPDKHQLKFNIHKDAKTLKEVIEKRFGGNQETKKVQKTLYKQQYENFTGSSSESLDQIHDRLQKLISQLEILGESLSQEDVNLNTNDQVSVVANVSVASAKIPFSALLNVDTLSNVVIYSFFASQSNSPQLDNVDLKQIDAGDLEEMDLKWQMAMLTVRARKGHFVRECRSSKDTKRNVAAEPQRRNVPAEDEPTNYALMAFTSSSSSISDNEVVSCSKACTKAYATLQSYYDKLTDDVRKSQFVVISYKTGLESIEARLLVYQQNEYVFEEDIELLKLEVQLRDNALVVLRQKIEKAKQERDDLKLTLEKFETSSKNLSQLLASQTNDKTRLGYNTQVFTSSMFDCDEMFTSETDKSLPASPIHNRYHSRDGYHDVPPPYTGTFMPPKPDLVFHDSPNVIETIHIAFNVELSPTKPEQDLSHTHRLSAPIIEDWVSDLKDDFEAEILQNAPSFVQPSEQVKPPRSSVKIVETFIPAAIQKTTIPKTKSNGNSRNRKACFICKILTHLIKDSVLTMSKLDIIPATRPVTAVVLKTHVTRPRPAKTIVTKPHLPPRRTINRILSPKASTFPPKVTAAKALMVNAVKVVKGN
nr:ribonuclease H-like domain-containing protein [Tanacetum cinerariifolium]